MARATTAASGVPLHVRTISAQTCLAAGASLLAMVWAVWLGQPDFPLDDSYILQHAVDGLLLGREVRFLGSTPLQGVTSPAAVLPITALALLLPTPWAQLVFTTLAAVLYLVGVYRLAAVAGLGAGWSMLLAVLALIAGRNLFQLLNGLETGLAMAAVTWLLVWFRDAEPDRHRSYALVGLLPLIRPGDTVLCEAFWSTLEPIPAAMHLTAAQAAGVARDGGAGELILTHILDAHDPAAAVVAAREVFDGPVRLADVDLVVDVGVAVS